MDIKRYLREKCTTVEEALRRHMLQAKEPFVNHIEAMRYSLFAGGKRIRPILCLAAGEAVDDSPAIEQNLLPIACALECIHTYSLIHDDLPAMDNDDLRRGKPTNHKLFGEAGAILAGDGLLTWAFHLLSCENSTTLPPGLRLKIIQVIAKGAGPLGMVGGQALDIENENNEFPFRTLQTIHKNKTGALIVSAVQAGAIGAGGSTPQIDKLIAYARYTGLAFQIVDDLLNVTATTEQLGKTAGSDPDHGKATYPSFFGVEGTREKALEAVTKAKKMLNDFDHKADPLRNLADFVYSRSH